MVIAGAGAAGKETFGILTNNSQKNHQIVFYDDNKNSPDAIFNKIRVIKDKEDLKKHLLTDPLFCVAIGNSRMREKVYCNLMDWGGQPINIVSPNAFCISLIENNGTIIQPGAALSFDVSIGRSCMIHVNSTIGHKTKIGNYVNISPLVSIIGPISIGDHCFIGAGSVILPNITIGKQVIIPAGSVVNRNLDDYESF